MLIVSGSSIPDLYITWWDSTAFGILIRIERAEVVCCEPIS